MTERAVDVRIRLVLLPLLILAAVGLLFVLGTPFGGLPAFGTLLDPVDGLYRTARLARAPQKAQWTLPGLEAPVTVVRDDRGVPHIFSQSDRDAVMALGYVVARDRLFQLDFVARVAAGRLAEALGPSAVPADRFLRRTGMEWGARKNWRRIQAEGGLEHDLIQWYVAGVNAYRDALAPEDLPFEFRLLGYRPERYTPMHVLRLLQYMNYDLSYETDAAGYADLQARLSKAAYRKLYPRYSDLFVPIIPAPETHSNPLLSTSHAAVPDSDNAALVLHAATQRAFEGTLAEGFRSGTGKGSNNWAVHGERSATGAPILAGDMHLALTLPAIWYEVHLATPTMNTYGVTIPGAPLPVEAFNDHVGWAFTNTGSDQIDHYSLGLDAAGTHYRYNGRWRAIEMVPDTIFVKGQAPLLDTLRYTHWGPMVQRGGNAVAIHWTAHEPSTTLRALWGMNHARDHGAFQEALRDWGTPMQNILYAGADGTISIRSTGYLPVRKAGHGMGLLDGTTDASAWTGRVPFDDLPYAINPEQGYLTSTNQQPTDSSYAYYVNHDWRDAFRSLRIDALLAGKPQHSVEDLQRYQADVQVVQHALFMPLLDTLTDLSPRGDSLRQVLRVWDGWAGVDAVGPLALDVLIEVLEGLAWDEPVFARNRRPHLTRLYRLMTQEPVSSWLDVQATPETEDAAALMRRALHAAADTLAVRYGPTPDAWRWGDHHTVLFRHLLGSDALRALGRGPVAFPGFAATLSPAGGQPTTHSASWRVVVDFAQEPPVGVGIYPGGQSGNPFSRLYDLHLPAYLAFEYYDLLKPRAPEDMAPARVASTWTLAPLQ